MYAWILNTGFPTEPYRQAENGKLGGKEERTDNMSAPSNKAKTSLPKGQRKGEWDGA